MRTGFWDRDAALRVVYAGTAAYAALFVFAAVMHYVEFKNQLTDANWSALTTISGSGSSTNVTDPTATNVTRFYRVRSQ